ncbi:MAG TPA: polysaccharide deacetylase family protein [Xanthobacteraceae bacterium]|nr:polysaccharide deacetylase family protein [Xanthobacteraceae bacterium]
MLASAAVTVPSRAQENIEDITAAAPPVAEQPQIAHQVTPTSGQDSTLAAAANETSPKTEANAPAETPQQPVQTAVAPGPQPAAPETPVQPVQTAAQPEQQPPTAAATPSCPGNPNAIGTSRVLPVAYGEYTRLGRMQYPQTLPLNDKEVVLTFDDGPLPPYSNQVLNILASECVKVTYFMVGTMARAYPATVRAIYEQGHTIGTHSDHHPFRMSFMPVDRIRQEIDGGIANVGTALGGTRYLAPFFRIPGLDRSATIESELAERSLVLFSSDTVADDWHHRITPGQIIALALKRLQERGKGILLLHDIHPTTVAALPGLLKALKDNGFRIVQVVPSAGYLTAMAAKPKAQLLASAVPGELEIDAAAQPTWPAAPAESTADLTARDIALPAPDPSAFVPESGVVEDRGSDVHWPDQPAVAASLKAADADDEAKGSSQHGRYHGRARAEQHAEHTRRPMRGRPTAQAPDLSSRIKSVAALFSPAH